MTLPFDAEAGIQNVPFESGSLEACGDHELQRSLAASLASGDVADTQVDVSSPEPTGKAILREHVKDILTWRGHNAEEAARFATPSPSKTAGAEAVEGHPQDDPPPEATIETLEVPDHALPADGEKVPPLAVMAVTPEEDAIVLWLLFGLV